MCVKNYAASVILERKTSFFFFYDEDEKKKDGTFEIKIKRAYNVYYAIIAELLFSFF